MQGALRRTAVILGSLAGSASAFSLPGGVVRTTVSAARSKSAVASAVVGLPEIKEDPIALTTVEATDTAAAADGARGDAEGGGGGSAVAAATAGAAAAAALASSLARGGQMRSQIEATLMRRLKLCAPRRHNPSPHRLL